MELSTTPIQRLTAALKLEELSGEEQTIVIDELHDLILRGTLVRLVDRMDDKTQEEFKKFLDSNPGEREIEAFLMERVPNADTAAKETIDELTDDILAVSKE